MKSLISMTILISIGCIILSACKNSSTAEPINKSKTTTNFTAHQDSIFNGNFVVKGESMSPTFQDGDEIFISYSNLTPEKGDILVINSYGLHETIIKRCIGTEGDKIKIDYNKNTVEVNGEVISNDYLRETMRDKPTYNQEFKVSSGVYEYIVPDGKIFVMGDNRNGSSDSRSSFVGFINEEDVLGKVIFRIYPFSELGRIESFI